MFRYNDQKDSMKFNTETGLKLLLASLLCSLAGMFWQPVFLGAAGVILSFIAMKSPKGLWGIPLFFLGFGVMISTIYR
ncbi:MAG: hypothetical protein GX829_01430 [Clostridium sp.]|nr:hypothetical protein [Clostridium sp.]